MNGIWGIVGILALGVCACGGGSASAGPGPSAQSSGGASEASVVHGSCALSTHACEQYEGAVPATVLARRHTLCTTVSGTWSEGACSAQGAIAGCRMPAPDELEHTPGTFMTSWVPASTDASLVSQVREECTREHGQFLEPPH
jgi:hypothetical protein